MRVVAPLSLLAAVLAVGAVVWLSLAAAERPSVATAPPRDAVRADRPDREPRREARTPRRKAERTPTAVRWRDSRALGIPSAGRLERGVQLPAEGRLFETWDPILRRSPNRPWRRWGTDEMVRLVLRVASRFHELHPEARPMLVGDLSRPRGGDFGVRYGSVGHSTHQNGLDVDIYYPRRDGRPGIPRTPRQVDRRLAQALVDLFVAAGAQRVLVGPNVALRGPRDVVVPYPNHDNHLHVRIRNPRS